MKSFFTAGSTEKKTFFEELQIFLALLIFWRLYLSFNQRQLLSDNKQFWKIFFFRSVDEKSLFNLEFSVWNQKLSFNYLNLGPVQESPKLKYTIVQSSEWRYSCHLENSFASIAHWMQCHLALIHNILWNFLRVQLLD